MTEESGIRLNKYLSDAGIASRRTADSLIEAGRVRIIRAGGKTETGEAGMRIFAGDRVFFDGAELTGKRAERVYLMLNKPKGLVCTADPAEPANVITYVNYPERITYAGRLDKDSRGLLILTNDGGLIEDMMRAARGREKEYICRLKEPVTETFLQKMRRGVVIRVPDKNHDIKWMKTRPCEVTKIDDYTVSVTLTQGLNRQIRRMCFALGNQVTDLQRVRIMSLTLGDLEEGCWRHLTAGEVNQLRADCRTGKAE